MKYKYTAFTEKGNLVQDAIIAKNKEAAETALSSRGLTIDSIKTDWLGALKDLSKASISGVSFKDKIVTTRNLAVMIKAGLTLDESLSIIAEQSTNPRMASTIEKVHSSIQAGKTLGESLAEFPKIFDELYVNIVSASEQGGTLEDSLIYLADQQTQNYELRTKIKNALFYPVLVISATGVTGILLSIFVLPKVTRLFTSFGTELPFATRALIGFTDFITTQTLWVVLGLVFLVFVVPFIFRLKSVRPIIHKILLHLPIFGKIVAGFNLSLMARTLGTLLQSGVPINQALEVTSNTMRNVKYKEALNKISQMQETGERLGDGLREYTKLFPPIVNRMVSVGEESGNLEEILEFLAEFHESEVDSVTKNLSTIMEPLLLIVIGAAVAIIALAIISPIYQITGSFNF